MVFAELKVQPTGGVPVAVTPVGNVRVTVNRGARHHAGVGHTQPGAGGCAGRQAGGAGQADRHIHHASRGLLAGTGWIERGMGKCLRDGRTLRRATKP